MTTRDPNDPNDPHAPEMAKRTDEFPFGELNPDIWRVGDYVGLIYSDHEHYVFDNPEGVITHILVETDDGQKRVQEYQTGQDEDDDVRVVVTVPACIPLDKIYLIARPKPGQSIAPDGEISLVE